MSTTAIVIAGAGARGAYEAGLLSMLVPRVFEEHPDEQVLLVGTSAGAINTALLAGVADPQRAVDNANRVWGSVDAADVFAGLPKTAFHDAVSYLGEILLHRKGLPSVLQSKPLRRTMATRMNWGDLHDNLDGEGGWVRGAAVVTTSCNSDRTIVFTQGKGLKRPSPDPVRGIDYVPAELGVAHVLASAAIPVAFRPVRIDKGPAAGWHIDGGVRLNAPIKPAIDLGADRVVVVATTPDPDTPKATPVSTRRPDVFDAAGALLRAALVDRMAEDVRSLRRTNRLVPHGATVTAPGSNRPYRKLKHIFLGPPDGSVIRTTADRVFRDRYGWLKRPFSDLGALGRLIGGSGESRGELLSFLFFDPHFHTELIELGRNHAHRLLGPGPRLPWRT